VRISTWAKAAAGIAIAAAGLAVFLRGVDTRILAAELMKVRPLSVAISCVLVVGSIYIRALRWRLFLPNGTSIPTKDLFSHTIIGFMLNNIIPARAGEAGRALLLWRHNKVPVAVCVGSIIVERVFDTLLYMVFFMTPVLLIEQLAGLRPLAVTLGMIIGGVIVALIFYRAFPVFVAAVGGRLLVFLPRKFRSPVAKISRDMTSTLTWISSWRQIAMIIGYSILIGLSYSLTIVALAWSLVPISPLKSLLIQSFAALGSAIPLAPGYVGTIHASLLQGMVLIGVEEEKARAFAIIYHALTYIPVTALGLYYFFKAKISFGEITHARAQLHE
jgi:uncharacterized protein (TIRG00374 family)